MRALLDPRAAAVAVFCALTTSACTTAPPPPPEGNLVPEAALDPASMNLLAAHNAYRAEVGVPPLRWSGTLAAQAKRWAEHLASDVHGLEHSRTSGKGENLAMWTSGYKTPSQLVDLWADEKAFFVAGTFPDVSRLGDWKPVAHYSQMIWRNTTELGCGVASDRRNDYLVCLYSPQGNVMAQNVY